MFGVSVHGFEQVRPVADEGSSVQLTEEAPVDLAPEGEGATQNVQEQPAVRNKYSGCRCAGNAELFTTVPPPFICYSGGPFGDWTALNKICKRNPPCQVSSPLVPLP